MGNRGQSSSRAKKKEPTALEAFKENARQLNIAREEAKNSNALKLEFTDMTGKTRNFYWNGANFGDQYNSMAATNTTRNGTIKKKFKKPSSWK